MWRVQASISLIDLPNDFFIVRFTLKEDYNIALFKGPWPVGDHYLYVQRWKPKFLAEKAVITHLPIWIRFLLLPVEYYQYNGYKERGIRLAELLRLILPPYWHRGGSLHESVLRLICVNPLNLLTGFWTKTGNSDTKVYKLLVSTVDDMAMERRPVL